LIFPGREFALNQCEKTKAELKKEFWGEKISKRTNPS